MTSDATGGPIPLVSVTAYRDDGRGMVWRGDTRTDTTDATGTYGIGNVKPGTYRLQFVHNNGAYAYEFFNNAATLAEGATVTVTDLATTTANAQLALSAVVTGTITSDATGGPLPGKHARAYRFEPAWGTWQTVGANVAAAADGTYVLRGGMRTGAYRVEFYDDDDTYTAEFYNNKPDWFDLSDGVTVTAGTTLTGVSAGLALLAPDAYEPDDDSAHAVTAAVGPPITHTLTQDTTDLGDRDWSWFKATAGKSYVIEVLTNRMDTILEVFGTDASTRLAFNDDTDQANNSRLVWTAPASGRYYLRVRGYGPSDKGRYELRITETLIPAAPVAGTIKVTSTSPRRGRQVRFSGQFTPTEASKSRIVNFQKYMSGKWRTVLVYRLSSTGKYSIFWSEGTRGTRKFRVNLPPEVGWASSLTPTKSVRWR